MAKFCLECGKALEGRKCPACGWVFWNNPLPVVGVIVETEKGVVLCHNRKWPEEIFSMISGFVDEEELPEAAVLREVKEELGLEGREPELVGVYPSHGVNEIVLVYHVFASGEVQLNEEHDAYQIYTREELKGWPFGQDRLTGWPFGAGWAIRDWLMRS